MIERGVEPNVLAYSGALGGTGKHAESRSLD